MTPLLERPGRCRRRRAVNPLSEATRARIVHAISLVDSIVAKGIHAYGVNTGVGALSDTVVGVPLQRQLSRNLIMSHAVGVGAPLPSLEARAILAAAVNNHAHGYSGVRREVVETMVAPLDRLPLAWC